MSTSTTDAVTKAQQDDSATCESVRNREKDNDGLDGLETQFENTVRVSTSTKLVDENGDDTSRKVAVFAREKSVPLPDGTTTIDVTDGECDETTAKDKLLKNIPSIVVNKSVQRIASWIQNAQKILVLSGAGVSVAAGIPDFRTPGTGLYDNLQKYDLPYAEAVFDIQYYQLNPLPFVKLASELWPERHRPTLTHTFIALLAKKQLLLRNYTQNIDGLELMAGVPEHLVIECHGHFRSARCIRCKKPSSIEVVKECIVSRREVPICTHCKAGKEKSKHNPAYIKPDIVFFGEQLPANFYETLPADVDQADLCIVMGTSLQVPPTAYIPDMVQCNRVLLNRELVGCFDASDSGNKNDNCTDVFHPGDCDDSIMTIARLLGWDEELLSTHSELVDGMNSPKSMGSP